MQKFDVSVTFNNEYGESYEIEAQDAENARLAVLERLQGITLTSINILPALTEEQIEEIDLYYDTRDDDTHEGYLRMYGAEDRESVLMQHSSKTI